MTTFKAISALATLLALMLGGTTAIARSSDTYVGSATDFMEISQLFARYNAAVDNLDGRLWANTFTPDGVFQDIKRCVVGRPALEALVGSNPVPGRDQERFHIQSLGPIKYISRTRAEVRSTILVAEAAKIGNAPRNWLTAVAVDMLKRVDGEWLIARRVVYIDSQMISASCP